MFFKVCSVLLLLCVSTGAHRQYTGKSNFTRCDQLPAVPTNFSLVIANSPFHVYRSNAAIYNCSTGIGTGPRDEVPVYQGTYLVVQGSSVITSFRVQSNPANLTAITTICSNGVVESYRFLEFNFNRGHSYICVYICSSGGLSIRTFRCYGRNADDEAHIQRSIDYYLTQIPGAQDILDTQKNCPPQSYCPFFI